MKTALVVTDIQNGLTRYKNLHNFEIFLQTVLSAIEIFRKNDEPVIFIQHNNKILPTGSDAWQIDKRLDVQPEDLIIQKNHGNAFHKTDLKEKLVQQGINDLVFCGLTSHGCVKHSCLGALENGFPVGLLKNGHSCWNKNAHELVQKTEDELQEKRVDIVNLSELP